MVELNQIDKDDVMQNPACNNAKTTIDIGRYMTNSNGIHGSCIIINCLAASTNASLKTRSIDFVNLARNTFESLNYCVEDFQNQSSHSLSSLLSATARLNHLCYDSFVCCILARGTADAIFGEDDQEIKIDDLYSHFTSKQCFTLAGKPKLFFVQVFPYESIEEDNAINTKGMAAESNNLGSFSKLSSLPDCADFLLGYSSCTIQNLTENHPTYIQVLCEVLQEYSQNYPLLEMLTEVNRIFSQLFNSGYHQYDLPKHIVMLREPLYFCK